MNGARRRALIALGLMIGAAAVAVGWKPTKRLADSRPRIDLEMLFPKSFAEWAMDTRIPVQLVSPDLAAVLNATYNQTLSRTYANAKGDRIMLSVAYGGDQSDATRAHLPEVCYPAQGFQIISRGEGSVDADGQRVRIRRLVAKQGARNEPISYWITVGERIVLSGTELKLAQLAYTTRGVMPDGMLVRISSIDPANERAYAMHDLFLRDMISALQPAQRAQVFGSAA